jgi:hypothetical protein
MSRHLPRELGESGALRAGSFYTSERGRTRKGGNELRKWQREEAAAKSLSPLSISARLLRQINQQRQDAAMARHHRPARVS